MRIHEFISQAEWEKLAQLVYGNMLQAMANSGPRCAPKNAAKQTRTFNKVRPRTTKLRAPYAVPPKPLPKPAPIKKLASQPSQAAASYNPIKKPKPLPASTRDAIDRPDTHSQEAINLPSDMDQRGRAMLPKNKRGPAIWDMLNLD